MGVVSPGSLKTPGSQVENRVAKLGQVSRLHGNPIPHSIAALPLPKIVIFTLFMYIFDATIGLFAALPNEQKR